MVGLGSVIEGTLDCQPAALKHVSVDHGRFDVLVAEQFLYGTDIRSILKQKGGIEWKGGALHPCGCTFPPSPLQTGQAIFTASGSPTQHILRNLHGKQYGRYDIAGWFSVLASCSANFLRCPSSATTSNIKV
jgi:hypothetical protein